MPKRTLNIPQELEWGSSWSMYCVTAWKQLALFLSNSCLWRYRQYQPRNTQQQRRLHYCILLEHLLLYMMFIFNIFSVQYKFKYWTRLACKSLKCSYLFVSVCNIKFLLPLRGKLQLYSLYLFLVWDVWHDIKNNVMYRNKVYKNAEPQIRWTLKMKKSADWWFDRLAN